MLNDGGWETKIEKKRKRRHRYGGSGLSAHFWM